MAQACEADTAGIVEVVVLRAIRPQRAGHHHLGENRAARGGGDEVGEVSVGVLADGAEQVGVEDAGEAGVGAEQDEGVGEGDEEGRYGSLTQGGLVGLWMVERKDNGPREIARLAEMEKKG